MRTETENKLKAALKSKYAIVLYIVVGVMVLVHLLVVFIASLFLQEPCLMNEYDAKLAAGITYESWDVFVEEASCSIWKIFLRNIFSFVIFFE